MRGNSTGVALHADSLEEVPGHGMQGSGYGPGEGTKGNDFVVYGIEKWESVFWSWGFDGFAEAVDIILW